MDIRFAPVLALVALFGAAIATNDLLYQQPSELYQPMASPATIVPSIAPDATPATAPQLAVGQVSLSSTVVNPSVDTLTIRTTANEAPAAQTASIFNAASGATVRTLSPAAGTDLRWQWNGLDDAGKPAAPGDYRFELQLSDNPANQVRAASQPFTVTDKRMVVSLSQQTLSAYDGDQMILRTLVTTGGPELPTPTGLFHVMGKYSPLPVYSPWPKGSPYWFPDVTYQYALEFDENAQFGLYIHDASWRHTFGPGSNVVDGTPGEDVTGTHGCINVPLAQQEALYSWAIVGMPVLVKN